MRHKIIEKVSVEPVTLAEAKSWVKITPAFTQDDALIEVLISAARDYCEKTLDRAISPQKWEISYKRFGVNPMRLPLGIKTIEKVEFFNGGSIELLSEDFYDYNTSEPPYIFNKFGKRFPVADNRPDAVRITAQMGDETIDESILLVIRLLVCHWYETRQAVSTLAQHEVPLAVDALLSTFIERGFP